MVLIFEMPDINSNLNYNRPRDLVIGRRKLKAAPKVQSTLDKALPAHVARATTLAAAEQHPTIIPTRTQTTLDIAMPAHAARAVKLAAHPRAEKRRIFVIPDGTDEDSESDDATDLFRSRSTKRQKTSAEHQREIDAEARHNAQCEANRRAKDERLRRDNAALDAAVANPATFRQPVRLSINFNLERRRNSRTRRRERVVSG